MYKVAAVLCIAAVILSVALAVDIRKEYKSLIEPGVTSGDLKATLYASKLAEVMKVKVTDSKKACDLALQALAGDNTEAKNNAAQIISVLKCQYKAPETLVPSLEKVLAQQGGLVEKISALSALQHLGISTASTTIVDDMLKALDSASSAYLRGVALSIVSKSTLSPAQTTTLKNLLTKLGTQMSKQTSFRHKDNSISEVLATATLIRGVLAASRSISTPFAFPENVVNNLARVFFARSETTDVADAFAVFSGLTDLNGLKKRPVRILNSGSNVIRAGQESVALVSVVDVFGDVMTTGVAVSVSVVAQGSAQSVVSNQELTMDKSGNFRFDLATLKAEPGFYELQATASGASLAPAVSKTTIVSMTSIEIYDAELKVVDGERFALDKAQKKAPKITASGSQSLQISFKLRNPKSTKSVSVQQAFVVLDRPGQSEPIYFVAKYTKERGYEAAIVLSHSKKFAGVSGTYSLNIIVGDAFLDDSFVWNAAELDISFSGNATDASPRKSKVLPEIHHLFREAETHASVSTSRLFTVLTLAPLGLFLALAVVFVGINCGNCPGVMGAVYGLCFQACIGAVVALYAWFFYELNMFQVGYYLAILAVPTAFFGHRTLRAIYSKRVAK